MQFSRFDFPEGFLFGAATAAYQIEGSSFGDCGPCHWDTFSATPGNVVRAESGAVACDHYHRWPADLDLLQQGNFDGYRFSTSWARVMPDGVTVNPKGLDFYDRLVDGMLERGLKPFQTLYHWDLPSALADRGGWQNRDTALRFADYAGVIAGHIGDRVAAIATINEPWVVSWLGHFVGAHAPGLRDIRATARSMHHILLAHGLAVERLRATGITAPLGIVVNLQTAEPASDSPADRAAAARQDATENGWFLEPFSMGTYPALALEGLGSHLPQGWQDDMALIGQRLDWLGINYYTRHLYADAPGTPWPSVREVQGPLPKTQMGWEIYPQGLLGFLRRLRDEMPGLPLYITENGMAHDDVVQAGSVDDSARIGFINGHLAAMKMAIAEGANLRGFFYWSLLDNYEWAEGYEKRFGLVHVDYKSLTRTPKASYLALKQALARND